MMISRYILRKEYLLIFFAKATSQVHACMDLATARELVIHVFVYLEFGYGQVSITVIFYIFAVFRSGGR